MRRQHPPGEAVPQLVINPRGTYTDYFIVANGSAGYGLPERGADLPLRLRGRVPSRYATEGINATLEQGADEEGTIIVERFLPWQDQPTPGALVQFEGLVRWEGVAMHANGALVFDALETPPGILALLSYEGLSPDNRRSLTARTDPPLGTLRLW